MPTIDWSKAPDRATHCVPSQGDGLACWLRMEGDHIAECWNGIRHYTYTSTQPHIPGEFIPRPMQWDGQGLPPVGVEVEIAPSTPYLHIRHPEGARVKIYAHFTDDRGVELAAFVDSAGQVAGVATEKCFRPAPTPEQIAAQERDKATTEWLNKMAEVYDPHTAAKLEHILRGAGYGKHLSA